MTKTGWVGLALMLATQSLAAADHQRPNILIVLTSGQRADDIAALGNGRVRTPSLDRLVKLGTTFTRTYCMGSNDNGVGLPSRSMLFSGHSLYRLQSLATEEPSWPQCFAAAGYRTFITGRWLHGPKAALRWFADGGTLVFSPAAEGVVGDFSGDGHLRERRLSSRPLIEQVVDEARNFLGQENDGRPFLCVVALPPAPEGRPAASDVLAQMRSDTPPVPANFLPQHPFDNGEMLTADERRMPMPRGEAAVRGALAAYYNGVGYLDQQLGRLLAALESSGHSSDTMVVFTSDHGLALGSHGLLGMQNLYEHSMRVPLIIAGPRLPAGRRSSALAYQLDLFATLADLAEVPAPSGNEGVSLKPVLLGLRTNHRPVIGLAFRHVQRALNDGRWKLIAYPKVPRVQLFDLLNDPDERQDLAGDSAQATRLSTLGTALVQWQETFADPLPPITLPASP